MGFVISHALFACSILAFYFAWHALRKMDLHYKENILWIFTCIGSGVWNLGFYGVMVQADPEKAYYWRLVGMAGVFAFLIFATVLVTYIAGMKLWIRRSIYGYSCLGIILYFGLAQKSLVEYNQAFFGMTYSFLPSIWNDLYTIYSVLMAVIMTISLIWLLRTTKKKRFRILARKMLLADFTVALGMVFDTILPMLGMQAVPGSSFGQFIALIILYQAINFMNDSRIEVDNISKFIYYSLDLPVIWYDAQKKLRLANNCADVFFGFEEENLEQYNIDKLFEVEPDVFDFEQKRKDVDAIYKGNGTQCNLSINKVLDDYGDIIGYIVFVNDMSKHMRTIERLEEAIVDADRANEAKSVFLANMSHEIRTPMHAIIGFSELVLKSDISPSVRNYMEDIKLASNNLLVIINDILDISKIESGKMELVPANYYTSSLMKDVSLIITTQAEQKGLDFVVEMDDNLPTQMYGDKVRLRGVIINILNNAVKYTKEGSVSFQAKVRERDGDKVWLEFIVSDTGTGIREEELPKLFKKFERLDRKKNSNIEGSGLGLAISNGYVRLMGGEIQVKSVYGEGSVFTIIVPQVIVDDTPIDKDCIFKKENIAISDRFHVKSVEVLVVDDNKVNLRMAQGLLGSYGLTVDVADGGQKAIDICSEKCYPLVFMDQMMPQIDGVEAMHRIRELNPYYAPGAEGKIIVLTADAISGVREKLLNQGFDAYMGKPLDVKKLEDILLKYIPSDHIIVDDSSENAETSDDSDDEWLDELAEKLPALDVHMGASHCGNDVKEYLQILKIAYDYAEKRIEELRTYRKKKDYRNYTIQVHSLKSTAKNIGADEISRMAQEQENAGNNGDYAYIDEHSEKLLEDYAKLIQSIYSVLKEYGLLKEFEAKDSTEQNHEDFLEKDTVSSLLQSIENYLDAFEFDRIFEILEELDDCTLRPEDKEMFGSIAKAMKELAVDDVREIISKNI